MERGLASISQAPSAATRTTPTPNLLALPSMPRVMVMDEGEGRGDEGAVEELRESGCSGGAARKWVEWEDACS